MNSTGQIRFENRPRNGQSLWCDSPNLRVVLNEIEMADNDKLTIEQFATQGYIVIKGAVPQEVANQAKSDYETLIQNSSQLRESAVKERRLPNFHRLAESGKKVFTRSREALRLQDMLFGYRSSAYTSLYFKHGTEQPIHRDSPVFCTQPANFYFGVWYALEDADARNGALRAIPGGHHLNTIDPYRLAMTNAYDYETIHPTASPMWAIYQKAVQEECALHGLREISIEMEKGDVLIWHPLLPHGGGRISDHELTRHSMVYHVVPEGSPVYQMDVFFNPSRQDVPDYASWSYDSFEDRLFAVR